MVNQLSHPKLSEDPALLRRDDPLTGEELAGLVQQMLAAPADQ